MADETPDTPEQDGTTAERLTGIESRLDTLAAAVARLIPGSHGEAEQRTEDRLDRPSSIEEQVRAELARAKSEQEQEAQRSEHETLKETVARLAEKPPQPPERRATKVMWGAVR